MLSVKPYQMQQMCKLAHILQAGLRRRSLVPSMRFQSRGYTLWYPRRFLRSKASRPSRSAVTRQRLAV